MMLRELELHGDSDSLCCPLGNSFQVIFPPAFSLSFLYIGICVECTISSFPPTRAKNGVCGGIEGTESCASHFSDKRKGIWRNGPARGITKGIRDFREKGAFSMITASICQVGSRSISSIRCHREEAREQGYEAHLVTVPTGHVDRNATSNTLPVDDDLGLAQQGVLSNVIESRLSVDSESLFRWCSL